MSAADLALAGLILAGAGWLLYRSLWKRRGHCHGCEAGCLSPPRGAAPGIVHLGRPGEPPRRG